MCDCLVALPSATDGPFALFAKNSDRDANEGQGLEWLPALSYPEGSSLACTGIEIPQVTRTHAVLLRPVEVRLEPFQ